MSVFFRRIMGVETEYGISAVAPPGRRIPAPEEVAREMFRPIVEEYSSSNIFTDNASRLYLDVGSHPEIATAECDSLSQLLAYEQAGDRIVDSLAREAEENLVSQGIANKVFLFKNNVDSAGNSYGCHENYLVGRENVLRDLGKSLMAFMVTRQLICGAGTIGPSQQATGESTFLMSQRADQVWEGVSSATTRSRPIFNTRDEPHGDSSRFRRLHVIIGDSNMAQPSFSLKVGSTLLMLEMIEAGFDLPDLAIDQPIVQLRRIARDLTGRVELPLSTGGSITALGVQRLLHGKSLQWLKERPVDTVVSQAAHLELEKVVELWGKVLDAIETGDHSAVRKDVDWMIKLNLLEEFRAKIGLDWSHPKLAQIDLTYHNIRQGRGLHSVLARRGLVNKWIAEADIEQAMSAPPATTRAAMRGEFLKAARRYGSNITVDWTRFKVNRPEPQTREFLDPFQAADPLLDELLEYMTEHSSRESESAESMHN